MKDRRSGETMLEDFAKKELELAGLYDKDSCYGGAIAIDVMSLIQLFARQSHSGGSAGLTIDVFERLARLEPLTPLTGADDEWIDHGNGCFQNKRCGHVFKQDGKAYDSKGRVFREPDGSCFTNSESLVDIKFPYMPKTEYVDRPA